LHALGSESFWFDELETWYRSDRADLADLLVNCFLTEAHPPLSYILDHYLIKAFGASEIVLRLPSVLFGTLSIVAMFFLGKRLFSAREGLYGAALIAFMQVPVYYSQEARMYSMMIFWTIVCLYFLTGITRSDNDRLWTKHFIGLLASGAVLGLTHYFGLCFVTLQSLWLIWTAGKGRRAITRRIQQCLLLNLVLVPAYYLLVFQYMHHIRHSTMLAWIQPCQWNFGLWYIKYMFNGWTFLFIVFIELFGYLLIRGVVVEKQRFIISSDFLCMALLVTPIMLTLVASRYFGLHVCVPRYLLIVLPLAFMIFARAVAVLPLANIVKDYGVAVLCCIIILTVFPHDGYHVPHKAQFREAVQFIGRYTDPDKDNVALFWVTPAFFDYYNINKRIQPALFFREFNNDDLIRLTEAGRKNIVLMWLHFNNPDQRVLTALHDRFTVLERLDFREISVLKLTLKGTDRP